LLTALSTPITDVVNACLLWSFEQTHHDVHNSLYAHCQTDHHLQHASLCIYTYILQCHLDSISSSNSSDSGSSREAAAAAAAQSALLEVKVSSTSNSLVMHASLPPLCFHCSVSLELLPWLHAPYCLARIIALLSALPVVSLCTKHVSVHAACHVLHS